MADLFCGAGGFTTGLHRELIAAGVEYELVAVNHWPIAIETHRLNHPHVRHYVEDLHTADPEKLVPEGRLDLLMASPSCTHHSRARGGKPTSDQQRMDPWCIIRWCTKLRVKRLLIENVPEYVDWGPVDSRTGKPLKSGRGKYFDAWVDALRGVGFRRIEWRVLNAADYGDATTRERFFLMARTDREPISWPVQTHSRSGVPDLFGNGSQRWRAAREIIDWTDPGRSIFDRKRPLSPNTIRRISAGLRKFGGPAAEPFLVVLRNHMDARSVDEPLPAITAGGTHLGVAQPFVFPVNQGEGRERGQRSVDEPLPTVVTRESFGVATPEAFVLGQQSGATPRSVDSPLPTVAAGGAISLTQPVAEPVMVEVNHSASSEAGHAGRARSIDEPLPTVTAARRGLAIAEPVLVKIDNASSGDGAVSSVDAPLPTSVTKQNIALAEPFLTPFYGTSGPTSVDEPLDTVTTKDRFGLAQPFIVPQFGEREGQEPRTHSIDAPMPAVTSHGAGALVEPAALDASEGGRLVNLDGVLYRLDIRFRMLRNRELARSMSFEDGEFLYEFVGTGTEVTRQIGNAVPVRTARALGRAHLADVWPAEPEKQEPERRDAERVAA
jgi:DNA (cytosine-5)-methyltransferase 1